MLFGQGTTSVKTPFSGYAYNECNGEYIYIEGIENIVYSYTYNPETGNYRIKYHDNSKGQGTGILSLSKYQFIYSYNFEGVVVAGDVATITLDFKLVGQGQTPNLNVHSTYHNTFNANGELTVVADNFKISCN